MQFNQFNILHIKVFQVKKNLNSKTKILLTLAGNWKVEFHWNSFNSSNMPKGRNFSPNCSAVQTFVRKISCKSWL